MKTETTNLATDSKIISGATKTAAHEKLVTQAIARYARIHNEYAGTVRQNTDLNRAAVAEWNQAHAKA